MQRVSLESLHRGLPIFPARAPVRGSVSGLPIITPGTAAGTGFEQTVGVGFDTIRVGLWLLSWEGVGLTIFPVGGVSVVL